MHAYTSEIFIYVYTLFVCMIVLVKVLDKNIINISNLKRKKTLSPQPKKRCRMFWNGKLCILMTKLANYVHLELFYVLDYSGIFWYAYRTMRKKWEKNPQKRYFLYGRVVGLITLRTGPQFLVFFFTPSLTENTEKVY